MEFKVGDKVKVIKNSHYGHSVDTIGIVEFVKKSTESETVFYVIKANNLGFNHCESDLELVKEFNIKIGDKCKIPKTKSVGGSMEESYMIGKVKKANQDFLYYVGKSKGSQNHMLAKDFDPKYLSGDFFDLNEIELYEEEFPKKWAIKVNTKEEFDLVCGTLNKQKSGAIYLEPGCGFEGGSRFVSKEDDFRGYTYDRLNIWNDRTLITLEQFKKHILKESTIMKNLLETEFVIENCTLSQRLAIKAYCDEKKIEYTDNLFTTINYSHICCLFKKEKRRFTGHVSNKLLDGKVLESITFSELIQFLDQYQPEPEFKFKKGDFLKRDNRFYLVFDFKSNDRERTYLIQQLGYKENGSFDTKEYIEKHFVLATPEEIKKWKEENEIKLPKIDGNEGVVRNNMLVWGCTEISFSVVKVLLDLKTTSITIKNCHLDNVQIQQIKKFIEHNKL